jgi:hypothetical protein
VALVYSFPNGLSPLGRPGHDTDLARPKNGPTRSTVPMPSTARSNGWHGAGTVEPSDALPPRLPTVGSPRRGGALLYNTEWRPRPPTGETLVHFVSRLSLSSLAPLSSLSPAPLHQNPRSPSPRPRARLRQPAAGTVRRIGPTLRSSSSLTINVASSPLASPGLLCFFHLIGLIAAAGLRSSWGSVSVRMH